jgi:hypothetical protein
VASKQITKEIYGREKACYGQHGIKRLLRGETIKRKIYSQEELGLRTSSSIKISNFQNINVATSLYI